nr:MAG TPA: ChiA1-BD-binding domain protein [Caudoviricetes sp.]
MTRAEAIAYRNKIETAASTMTDATALTAVELFPVWESGKAYAVSDRAQYNGTLYKCIQAHTSQADWTPDATPALWVKVSIDEYPEWVQPTGAHDAYNIGDKVTYNGQRYVCTSDANVYAPDVYGWELVNNG